MIPALLLAQTPYQNRLDGLRGAFDNRPTNPTDITGAVILFGCVIAITVIWSVARRISLRRSDDEGVVSPTRLFDRVLQRMGVGLRDRLLLRFFARSTGLSQPVLVFFDEAEFDQHADRWIRGLSFEPIQRRARAGIDTLRARAFPTKPSSSIGTTASA